MSKCSSLLLKPHVFRCLQLCLDLKPELWRQSNHMVGVSYWGCSSQLVTFYQNRSKPQPTKVSPRISSIIRWTSAAKYRLMSLGHRDSFRCPNLSGSSDKVCAWTVHGWSFAALKRLFSTPKDLHSSWDIGRTATSIPCICDIVLKCLEEAFTRMKQTRRLQYRRLYYISSKCNPDTFSCPCMPVDVFALSALML